MPCSGCVVGYRFQSSSTLVRSIAIQSGLRAKCSLLPVDLTQAFFLALSSQFVYKAFYAIDDDMPRVKWDTLTDESQAMVKKVGLFSVGGIILLFFSKMIFPLVVLGGGGYVAWRALNKK